MGVDSREVTVHPWLGAAANMSPVPKLLNLPRRTMEVVGDGDYRGQTNGHPACRAEGQEPGAYESRDQISVDEVAKKRTRRNQWLERRVRLRQSEISRHREVSSPTVPV